MRLGPMQLQHWPSTRTPPLAHSLPRGGFAVSCPCCRIPGIEAESLASRQLRPSPLTPRIISARWQQAAQQIGDAAGPDSWLRAFKAPGRGSIISRRAWRATGKGCTVYGQFPKILDFRGFDSSVISNLRGGISRLIGNFPESLSHAILVGIILGPSLRLEIGRSSRRPLRKGGWWELGRPAVSVWGEVWRVRRVRRVMEVREGQGGSGRSGRVRQAAEGQGGQGGSGRSARLQLPTVSQPLQKLPQTSHSPFGVTSARRGYRRTLYEHVGLSRNILV